MNAISKTLTFPFRRPIVTTMLAAAALVTSSVIIGPVETLKIAAEVVGGATTVLSTAATAVHSATDLVTGAFKTAHDALTCPGVVEAVRTHGVTQQLAPKIAECSGYFPPGAN